MFPPAGQCRGRIALRCTGLRAHDAQIAEGCGTRLDPGIFRVASLHDRHFMFARQRDKFLAIETRMTRFEGVTQRAVLQLARQLSEKCRHVLRVEWHGRRELPVDRTELGTESQNPALEKALNTGVREALAVCHEPRRLDAEHESVGRLVVPFLERRWLLQTVKRRVDLDRGEVAARVMQLLRLRQALGVETAAPWGEVPATDAHENPAGFTRAHVASLAHDVTGFVGTRPAKMVVSTRQTGRHWRASIRASDIGGARCSITLESW